MPVMKYKDTGGVWQPLPGAPGPKGDKGDPGQAPLILTEGSSVPGGTPAGTIVIIIPAG